MSSTAIRPLLTRLGLDDKEVEVYLALLSLQTARAAQLAKAARQSRSHTYLIVRSLMEKGLVSEVERGKIIHFVAEPPERLLRYLEQREQEARELHTLVEGALPVLQGMTSPLVGQPRVTMHSGVTGMKEIYREMLNHEFVALYNHQRSLDVFNDNIVTMVLGKQPRLHGRDLLVNNEAAKQYIADVPQHEGYEIRLLPEGCSFPTDTLVFNDVIVMMAYDDEKTIVRIQNQPLADTIRAWHATLWQQSTAAA